jgi:hypothetical protein
MQVLQPQLPGHTLAGTQASLSAASSSSSGWQWWQYCCIINYKLQHELCVSTVSKVQVKQQGVLLLIIIIIIIIAFLSQTLL